MLPERLDEVQFRAGLCSSENRPVDEGESVPTSSSEPGTVGIRVLRV